MRQARPSPGRGGVGHIHPMRAHPMRAHLMDSERRRPPLYRRAVIFQGVVLVSLVQVCSVHACVICELFARASDSLAFRHDSERLIRKNTNGTCVPHYSFRFPVITKATSSRRYTTLDFLIREMLLEIHGGQLDTVLQAPLDLWVSWTPLLDSLFWYQFCPTWLFPSTRTSCLQREFL